MKIIKGDQVLIISGKDKLKKGKVIRSFPGKGLIVVEGVNLKKKHIRPKREGEKGQIVSIPGPIDVSNAKLICPKCGKASRLGLKALNRSLGERVRKKIRICKKCGAEI